MTANEPHADPKPERSVEAIQASHAARVETIVISVISLMAIGFFGLGFLLIWRAQYEQLPIVFASMVALVAHIARRIGTTDPGAKDDTP